MLSWLPTSRKTKGQPSTVIPASPLIQCWRVLQSVHIPGDEDYWGPSQSLAATINKVKNILREIDRFKKYLSSFQRPEKKLCLVLKQVEMLCITESAPHYALKSSSNIYLVLCCPWIVSKNIRMGKGGRKKKRKMAGTPISILLLGETCRAATDKPLVCITVDKHLWVFTFYFSG